MIRASERRIYYNFIKMQTNLVVSLLMALSAQAGNYPWQYFDVSIGNDWTTMWIDRRLNERDTNDVYYDGHTLKMDK